MATKKILFLGYDVEAELEIHRHDNLDTEENEKKFDKILSKTAKKKSELKVRDFDTDAFVMYSAWVDRPEKTTDTAWRETIDGYASLDMLDDDTIFHIVEVE